MKSPITVARKILDQRQAGLLSLGRIPPMYVYLFVLIINLYFYLSHTKIKQIVEDLLILYI